MSTRNRCISALGVALVAVYHAPAIDAQQCQSKTYTTDNDFDDGFVNNADRSTSGSIKVNALPVPLPYLSVAKTGAGSVVRIDTRTGLAIGEHWTTPGRFADTKQPSRTTVDLFGNTWAANRYEYGLIEPDVQMGSVVKIGLVLGDTEVNSNGVPRYFAPPFDYCTCIDRDNDGLIRTSFGLNDALEWPDERDDWLGGGVEGGAALVEEATDECILVYQRTNGTGARHIAVNHLGQVWVGGYLNRDFDLLDGEDGSILATFNVEHGAYGGLMDGNGVLWSTQEQNPSGVLRYDTRGTLMLADDWWDYIPLYHAYGTSMDRFG